MYIEGDRFNLPFATNSDYIYPCSLPDPTQCASMKELSNLQVSLIQMVKVAKYKDKEEPLELALDADSFFYLDVVSKTKMTLFSKMNHIYDDDKGFKDPKLTQKFIDVNKIKSIAGSRLSRSAHSTKKQIQEGICEAYMEIIMRSGYEKMVIQRRYRTLFQIISEVGGFNDLIYICLWGLYFLYNRYAFNFKRFVKSLIETELSQLLLGSKSNPRGSNQLDNNNPQSLKQKIESYRKFISEIKENSSPLSDVSELTQINSKSRIILEMVFTIFPLRIMEPICAQIHFRRKIALI